MKIHITKTENGAMVEIDHEDADALCNTRRSFIFESDDNEIGLRGLQEMLYHVMDELGEFGNKHNKENVRVYIEHGHGYDCKDKKCPLCKRAV